MLWAGPNYITAYYLVLLIMVPLTVPMIQNVGVVILEAQNRNAFRSIVYAAIAAATVIASLLMAKNWGGVGCAIATGISLIIFPVIIMNVYYGQRIGLDIPLFWKNIARLSTPAAVALLGGYGINYFWAQNSIWLLAIKILGFSVIYVIFMWFGGVNLYEKELFMSPLKWLLNKKSNIEVGLHN
jgi:O-antigen/teichoic acid export membrane protein